MTTQNSPHVRFYKRWISELLEQWRDLWLHAAAAFPKGIWLIGLLLVMLGTVLARLPVALSLPMTHDESYTFIAFASQPLPNVVTDYHLPNNHILNSILVHFSTRLFGSGPLAVRLPAVIAGIVAVLAVCLLARVQYGDAAALVAAAITAYLKAQIDISILARGYSLLGLLVLLEFLLAEYLRRHRNMWGWLLFAILAAAGFYTVPIMLYPIGAIGLWLTVSALSGDVGAGYKTRWHFIGWLAGAAALTAVLTMLLYLPVILVSGLDALIHNPFVTPLSTGRFLSLLPHRIEEIWRIWQAGIGASIWLLVIGFFLSIALARKACAGRIPPQLGLLWIPLAAAVQHPNPWPKIFMYLLPLFILWGVGGWFLLMRPKVSEKWPARLAILLSAAILVMGIVRDIPKMLELPPQPGEVEQAVLVITEEYQPGDVLLAASPNDAPAWYYAFLYGIGKNAYTHLEDRTIERAFVLVNPGEGQTIEAVIRERNLNPDDFAISTAQTIFNIQTTLVYRLETRE